MSETAEVKAKDSGLNAAVLRSPLLALAELVKRFGIVVVLLGLLAYRQDQQHTETREMNKTLTESALQNSAKFATIVEQNTTQSKQTQQAIEKFTESTNSQQRVMERVLDRLERSSSSYTKQNPRAPVIE